MAGSRVLTLTFKGDASSAVHASQQIEGHMSKMGTAVTGAFFGMGQMIGQELLSAGKQAFEFATGLADKFEAAGIQTSKLMRITGESAENMSTLRFAANDTGVKFETLSRSLVIFSRNLDKGRVTDYTDSIEDLGQAQDDIIDSQLTLASAQERMSTLQSEALGKGETWTHRQLQIAKASRDVEKAQGEVNFQTGESIKILDKVGIVTKDATGKLLPMWDVLKNTSAQFKSMPDGAQKTALAMQLFGRSGAELLPLLNKGADGFEELKVKAKEYGWALTQADVDNARAGVKSKRELSEAWEGLQIQLGGPVSQALTIVTNAVKGPLLESTKKLQEWMQSEEFKKGLTDTLDWLKTNVPEITSKVGDFLKGLGQWWGDHGEGIVDGFARFGDGVSQLATAFGEVGKALDPVFGTLQKIGDLPGVSQILGIVSGSKLREGFGDLTDVASGKKKVDGFFAQGGIVPATPGGRNVVVGEGGEAEWIIPQSKMSAITGGGGSTINVTVQALVPTRDTGKAVAEALRDYYRNGGMTRFA